MRDQKYSYSSCCKKGNKQTVESDLRANTLPLSTTWDESGKVVVRLHGDIVREDGGLASVDEVIDCRYNSFELLIVVNPRYPIGQNLVAVPVVINSDCVVLAIETTTELDPLLGEPAP